MSRPLEGTSLYAVPDSQEQAMRISGVRHKTADQHDQAMFQDAAKRVVFHNCMASCDLSDEQVPNFNANFYHNHPEWQNCLQSCFNAKMMLHFGDSVAKRDGLYMDFAAMKKEYEGYENWNPHRRIYNDYSKGFNDDKVNQVSSMLLQRSKAGQRAFNM